MQKLFGFSFHGTSVTSLAAGNNGVAIDADIVCVALTAFIDTILRSDRVIDGIAYIYSIAKSENKNVYLKGKVIAFADVLAKDKSMIDPDAAPYWLVLQSDDGKVYPLIKDDGSRMFFKDAKLLNRPMRLTARVFPNTQILQVINARSYVNGKLHEFYYWCDICTIRRTEAGICDCCLAPLEFREKPYNGD